MNRFGQMVGFDSNLVIHWDGLKAKRVNGLLYPLADGASEFEAIPPNESTQFKHGGRADPKTVIRVEKSLSYAFAQSGRVLLRPNEDVGVQ